jgi:hypothetical protein
LRRSGESGVKIAVGGADPLHVDDLTSRAGRPLRPWLTLVLDRAVLGAARVGGLIGESVERRRALRR